MELLKKQLEEVRREMHSALEAAGGDYRAPSVMALAEEFDRLLAEYMRRQLQEYMKRKAPGRDAGGSS